MRARFARPRRIVRGRLVAPVAAAAAVALVGGVVVATPDAPTVREDVQTVATVIPGFQFGAEASYDLNGIAWGGSLSGFEVTGVTGLPAGLTFENGVISGTPTESGVFNLEVFGNLGGQLVSYPVQLVVNLEDGSAPAGFEAGSSTLVQGSLGTEAESEAQVVTGSDGADSLLSAVASIVASFGGDAGSVTELVTGSTGNTDTPDAPNGPLGSVSDSLLGSTPTHPDLPPTDQTPGFPGSSTTGEVEVGGEAKVGQNLEGELIVPGSSIPGSSTTGTTGSLGDLAPGLALTGAALLGIAGLSLVLGGGSSTPGSSVPGLLGSSSSGAPKTTTGGSSTGAGPGSSTGPGGPSVPGSSTSRPGGSSGSVAPTVAAGSPKRAEAPGPTVANGRG